MLEERRFFKVVRVKPQACVRQKVSAELGFDSFDIIVLPHKVLHGDDARKVPVVDAVSGNFMDPQAQTLDKTFVLNLDAITAQQLADAEARIWAAEWDADASPPELQWPAELADDLVALPRLLV